MSDDEALLRKSAERLQLLADCSQELASATAEDVDGLLRKIAMRMGQILGELCSIRLLSADGQLLIGHHETTYHADPNVLASLSGRLPEGARVGDRLSGRVALTGEPVLVPSIDTEVLLARTPEPLRQFVEILKICSVLAVPLKAHDRVLGVITMTRSDPKNPYTQDDLLLARDIADRAALAIETSLLLDALRQSETRFRRLKDSGIIGIAFAKSAAAAAGGDDHAATGGGPAAAPIHDANDAFLSMVGYTREEFADGKVKSASLETPEQRETDAAARQEFLSSGLAHAWEKELFHKDGHRVPVLVGATRVEETPPTNAGDDGGENIFFFVDLTERKKAEAATRLIAAEKAAVLEAAIDGIVLMDSTGRITEINAASERLFGYTRTEALGRTLRELVNPIDEIEGLLVDAATGIAPATDTALPEENDLSSGQRIEVAARSRNGAVFPAEVAVVRFAGRFSSEEQVFFTAYIRDLTERKNAEEAEMLRREKDVVHAANRELETFSYSVAHDLRAPIRSIKGFTAILKEDHSANLDADANELIDRVAASADRMSSIIDALLSLAQLTRASLRRERVDLSELAQASMAAVIAAATPHTPERKESGLGFEFHVTPNLIAYGDRDLLRVVFDNLLSNAWKFTRRTRDERKALIEVGGGGGAPPSASTSDGTPFFFVRDNGAGFNMEYAAKLFRPFERLHKRDEFEGSGIGLATVARIIRRHGGDIKAEAKEGEGATFTFTLGLNATTPTHQHRTTFAPPKT